MPSGLYRLIGQSFTIINDEFVFCRRVPQERLASFRPSSSIHLSVQINEVETISYQRRDRMQLRSQKV